MVVRKLAAAACLSVAATALLPTAASAAETGGSGAEAVCQASPGVTRSSDGAQIVFSGFFRCDVGDGAAALPRAGGRRGVHVPHEESAEEGGVLVGVVCRALLAGVLVEQAVELVVAGGEPFEQAGVGELGQGRRGSGQRNPGQRGCGGSAATRPGPMARESSSIASTGGSTPSVMCRAPSRAAGARSFARLVTRTSASPPGIRQRTWSLSRALSSRSSIFRHAGSLRRSTERASVPAGIRSGATFNDLSIASRASAALTGSPGL
ncbi:hypothetical protein [Streptomyces cuspidosporus]|uniref:Secreted protein n=1 Tax=Streptomyces cuspidosporus TaxID=66882 RepID=A0ABN3HA70_9ACTN